MRYSLYLLIIFCFLCIYPGTSKAQVFEGNLNLTTQAEVDAFNYTSVTGGLVIQENSPGDITNLDGLFELTSIGEYLELSNTEGITDLYGLSNLTFVGGNLNIVGMHGLTYIDELNTLSYVGRSVQIVGNGSLINLNGLSNLSGTLAWINLEGNPALTSIDGLFGITSTDLGSVNLKDMPSLSNLNGLSNLMYINGPSATLSIWNLPLLSNLDGLSNLESVAWTVNIESTGITNLDGLSKLTSVGGYLSINYNNALADINGLANLTTVGQDIYIYYNTTLLEFCGFYNLFTGSGMNGNYYHAGNGIDPSINEIIEGGPCELSYYSIQYADLGQRVIDFLETNVDISLNVVTPDNIAVTYYPYNSPIGGTLPSGIVTISNYYWQVSSANIVFTNAKVIVPVTTLRGVTDASKLVWLKRTNSGDPWENIGGLVSGNNLENTVLFNSFSEFAIGTTDPANPLPVELSSFIAISKTDKIVLEWETKTEINNYGFEIERKVSGNWQKIGFVNGNGNSNSSKEYSFTDSKLIGGSKFQYRLKQIDNDGQFEYSDIVEIVSIPNEFSLNQNYPNPFNPVTLINYSIVSKSNVQLSVYDILGDKVVDLLNNNEVEPGNYQINFDASNLPSGVYIYRMKAGEYVETRKMILLK